MRSQIDVSHGRAARRVAAALSLVLALPVTAVVAYAQTGTVSGTVTDQGSNAPIPSAQVVIVGTTRGSLSGSDGKYTIAGAPSGPAQIRVTRIGYAAETRPVTVPTSSVATVDFLLAQTQVTLDQVVVTGTQTNERAREAGNTIAVIQTDSVNKAAVNSFSELITAKAAGVDVTQSSGEIGTGARIRIRGSNSVSLPNDPLLIIDGIEVTNSAQSLSAGAGVGGQTPSRFDDLNPDEIENVEILKGPSASALYGSAGANGVIVVTTKKGISGKAQWTAHADYGQAAQIATFQGNYNQLSAPVAPDTTHGNFCTLITQGSGGCTPVGGVQTWNPLEAKVSTPFTTNNPIQRFGAAVQGGSDVSRYFVSGDYDFTHGVYANNFLNRNAARANFSSSPAQNLDFSLSAGYTQSRSQLPQNDNNEFSPIASGVLGASFNPGPDGAGGGSGFGPSGAGPYGYLLVTPGEAQSLIVTQDIERFTGGLSATLRALPWLSLTGVAGIDFTERDDENFYPPGVAPAAIFGTNTNSGFALSNPFQFWVYTAQFNAQAQYPFTPTIHGTTSIGTAYTNQIERGTYAQGYTLAPGTSTIAGATSLFAANQLGNDQIVTIGYYAQQQVSWSDLLFVTAALRADDNSAFGQPFNLQYYPSVSASWVIGEEPWFTKSNLVSSLRLRAAYGWSGQRPQFQQAQTFLNAVPVNINGLELGGLSYGNFGNPDLKPELSKELEGGFDAGFWRDKIQFQLTGYMKTSSNALISVLNPVSVGGVTTGPSAGTSSRFINIGQVDNRGIEALLTSNLIDTRNARLDFTVNWSMNKNKLVSLGAGQAPIPLGLSTVGGQFIQMQSPGYPLASFFQPNVTCGAPTGAGGFLIPANCSVAAASTFHGPSFPEQLLSLNPSLTFFRYFRISTLFDNRNVVYTFNATNQFRCSLYNFANCQWDYQPKTTLKHQTAVVGDALLSDAGFIENAAFWKWREISLTMTAPDRWASSMHLRGLNLTIAGRNLHTWTPYTGSDPETNFNGSDNFTTTDFFTQPLVQTWIGRVNVFF